MSLVFGVSGESPRRHGYHTPHIQAPAKSGFTPGTFLLWANTALHQQQQQTSQIWLVFAFHLCYITFTKLLKSRLFFVIKVIWMLCKKDTNNEHNQEKNEWNHVYYIELILPIDFKRRWCHFSCNPAAAIWANNDLIACELILEESKKQCGTRGGCEDIVEITFCRGSFSSYLKWVKSTLPSIITFCTESGPSYIKRYKLKHGLNIVSICFEELP